MNPDRINSIAIDWRTDLEASREITELEKQHFGFVLAWFETWGLKRGLDPCREVCSLGEWMRMAVRTRALPH